MAPRNKQFYLYDLRMFLDGGGWRERELTWQGGRTGLPNLGNLGAWQEFNPGAK